MDSVELGKSYDQIAQHWDGDNFNRENGIVAHKRALKFLEQKKFALDVGCGSSGRLIDLMLSEGFYTEAIDVSEQMIALARKRHPQVDFFHEDVCDWVFPRKYDFISAWDSIWHIPLSKQEHVMKKLCEGLNEKGVLIYTTAGLDAPAEKVDSNMGVPVSYGVLGIPRTLALLAELGCVCRHLEYDQHPEMHLYIIAQKVK